MTLLPAAGEPFLDSKDTAKLTATPAGVWVPNSYVESNFHDDSLPDNDGHLGT